MRKAKRITLSVIGVILALAVIGISVFIYFIAGSYTSRRINIYEDLCAEDELLPDLNELGNYSDVKFRKFHQNYIWFSSDSYTLKVIYDDKNYELQKKQLDSDFMFQEKPFDNPGGQNIEPSFSYKGYEFRFLSDDYLAFEFPKKMYLIGINDNENTIAYVHFNDKDLDCLDTTEQFMNKYVNFE